MLEKYEVYVCGEGDTLVNIPESSDDVEVVSEKCDELYHYVSKLSPTLSKGHLLRKQACFLPVLNVPTSSGPLIGETNVKDLYIASGHSCWGINNAPATGKLMAEILLDGEATSAEISSLDPKLYFDATILS
ncbi:AEL_collapsed_G0023890.mRNA.1.CDS.1 [Saccharomyces cerevisiae]|nr:AEL_collapsed_G0023890.mRNA.1.CDS.1 [Saccharomyces cerevisiae]